MCFPWLVTLQLFGCWVFVTCIIVWTFRDSWFLIFSPCFHLQINNSNTYSSSVFLIMAGIQKKKAYFLDGKDAVLCGQKASCQAMWQMPLHYFRLCPFVPNAHFSPLADDRQLCFDLYCRKFKRFWSTADISIPSYPWIIPQSLGSSFPPL